MWPTFCMVWTSFCTVSPAFWTMCLTFWMSNMNLGFSKVPKNWPSCQNTDYHFLGGHSQNYLGGDRANILKKNGKIWYFSNWSASWCKYHWELTCCLKMTICNLALKQKLRMSLFFLLASIKMSPRAKNYLIWVSKWNMHIWISWAQSKFNAY